MIDKKFDQKFKLLKHIEKDYFNDNFIIPLPDELSKKFRVYSSMKIDLETCQNILKELISEELDTLARQALTYTAINLYAKCFLDASKSKLSKLEAVEIYLNFGTLLEIHNRIMDIRHNIISHRSINNDEVDIAYFVINKRNSEYGTLKYSRLKFVNLNEKELNMFDALTLFLYERINEKIEKIIEKTMKAFYEKYTNEEIGKMADLNKLF